MDFTDPNLHHHVTESKGARDSVDDSSSISGDDGDYKMFWDFPLDSYMNDADKLVLKNIIRDKNKSINMESLMKIYSQNSGQYNDVCSILVNNKLWFISANKYQIWLQFIKRSKIKKLIRENVTKRLDNKLITQIIRNLGIDDHNDLNKLVISKIKKYLKTKTIFDIKSDILLNRNNINSLSSLFLLDDQDDIPQIKQICITQYQYHQNDEIFLNFILNGIAYIDKKQIQNKNSLIITLKHYEYENIVNIINQRKDEFFSANNIVNDIIDIIPYYDDNNANITNSIEDSCGYYIDITKKCTVKPFNADFGFQLIKKDGTILSCLLNTNNKRHEWISYLDYVINYELNTMTSILPVAQSQKILINDKFMNRFLKSTPTNNNDNFIHDFGFGVDLNFWNSDNNAESIYVPSRYNTLKQELLKNNIYKISTFKYYSIYEKCLTEIKKNNNNILRANYIGNNLNDLYGVNEGDIFSINHMISIKIYTDNNDIQYKFKMQCRYDEKESIQQFIDGISEISHWCRYIKECCLFYSKFIKKKECLYIGIDSYLMFNSLYLDFKSPISITNDLNILLSSIDNNNKKGIILKLKQYDGNAKYFDASILSHFPQQKEMILMGSSLTIIDILINGKWNKYYILSIRLLEQILSGKFIQNCSLNTENELYLLLNNYLSYNHNNKQQQTVPKYIVALFSNIVQKMVNKNINTNNIWLNRNALTKLKKYKLIKLFYDFEIETVGQFFHHFNIKLSQIQWVQPFKRCINGKLFHEFLSLKPGKYIESSHGIYQLNNIDFITFHIKNYKQYSLYSNQCKMELYIKQLPIYIKSILIEIELFIQELKINYSIQPIWIQNRYIINLFNCKKLKNLSSLTVKLGIKVIAVQTKSQSKPVSVHSVVHNNPEPALSVITDNHSIYSSPQRFNNNNNIQNYYAQSNKSYQTANTGGFLLHPINSTRTPMMMQQRNSFTTQRMRSIFRRYNLARLIVFGVGIAVLPPKHCKFMATILLGTSNSFNWMYAYKYLYLNNNQKYGVLVKETVVTSVFLSLTKYLTKDPKYVGIGITMHGLYDIFSIYESIINKTNNHISSISNDTVIYAVCDILMGITTYFLWKKKENGITPQ